MTRYLGATIFTAVLFAGCSTGGWPAASPAFTPKAECERNGGWWHADMNFCEYQATDTIRHR
jgi:hypothetical protein